MTQTINVANVAIGLDIGEMQKNGDFARREINAIARMVKDSATDLDKYADQMMLLDKAYKAGGISAEQFAKTEESLAKKFGVLTYAMEERLNKEKALAQATRDAAEAEKKLADEAANLSRILLASETPMQRMHRDVQALDKAFAAGKISSGQYNQAVDSLAKKHGVTAIYAERTAAAEAKNKQAFDQLVGSVRAEIAAEKELQKTQNAIQREAAKTAAAMRDQSAAMSGTQNAIGSIKNLAAGYIGLTAAATGVKKAISLASDFERTRISFEVMTGSVAEAQRLMVEFKALDVESPLNQMDIARAAKTLMQFGMEAERIPSTLRAMSAISLGNTEQFGSLALAFGQTQAAGRLMGQEVLQMVNAGFNPLKEISRTTGKSMIDLRKEMEAGAITADMVAKAFESATKQGGLFFGMNERLAGSIAGQYAKLEGDVKSLGIQIGTELVPVLTEATGLIRELFQGAGGEGDAGIIGFNIGLISDAYGSMIGAMRKTKVSDLLNPLTGAQRLFEGRPLFITEMLDAYEQIKQAEKDRQADIEISKAQDAERLKSKEKEVQLAKELAEQQTQAAKAQAAAAEAVKKETENRKTAFDEIKRLRDELMAMTEGQSWAKDKKREEKGFTSQERIIAEKLEKQIGQEKRAIEAAKEADAANDALMTDREKAMAEIRKWKNITEDSGVATFRIQDRVAKKFAESQVDKVAPANIAQTIKAGTIEAFRFMQQDNAEEARQMQIERLQQSLLAEAQKANELAAQAPRLAKAR